MDRDSYRVRSLILVLVGSVVFLTTVQCTRRLAAITSRAPAVATIHFSPAVHTPEEVSDKGFDISRDANHQSRVVTEAALTLPQPAPVADLEIDVSPLRQLIHRRMSPSAPDDAFHSLPH